MRVSELPCHHWRATGGNTSCSPSRACTSVQIMGLVSVTSIYSWELVIQLKQLERRPAGAGGPTLQHKFCELRGQSRAGLVPGFPRLHTAGGDRGKIKILPENTPRQGKSATASFFSSLNLEMESLTLKYKVSDVSLWFFAAPHTSHGHRGSPAPQKC